MTSASISMETFNKTTELCNYFSDPCKKKQYSISETWNNIYFLNPGVNVDVHTMLVFLISKQNCLLKLLQRFNVDARVLPYRPRSTNNITDK